MPTLDATVAGASANSYITLASAVTYFEGRLDTSAWDTASTATTTTCAVALIMATTRLDMEEWPGEPSTTTQRLQWPRIYVAKPDQSGYDYDSDEMPEPVKNATCELALAYLKDTTRDAETGLEAFENVKLNGLDVTPRVGRKPGALPTIVLAALRGLRRASQTNANVLRG